MPSDLYADISRATRVSRNGVKRVLHAAGYTPSNEPLLRSRISVLEKRLDEQAFKEAQLKSRVMDFQRADAARDRDRAWAFAKRRGAMVGDNVWNFVLNWAEAAEIAIEVLGYGEKRG